VISDKRIGKDRGRVSVGRIGWGSDNMDQS
jgi:hypothetical protein